jgi:hypothetical protein
VVSGGTKCSCSISLNARATHIGHGDSFTFIFVPPEGKAAYGEMVMVKNLYRSPNWLTDYRPVATRDRHDFPGLAIRLLG